MFSPANPDNNHPTRNRCLLMPFILLLAGCSNGELPQNDGGIGISKDYPQYWEYGGKPVLLLGGSDEDNLFQTEGVERQLDLLSSAGGNYIRNTMSSRDSGNVWAFEKDPATGLYDLARWNEEYWKRFHRLLELTSEREIMVQVEIWATFDFYRENWLINPFNPACNINYSAERTRLPVRVDSHPTWCENPFFWSVPGQHNNMPVLAYQQRFVDQLLYYSLQYGNVLYCIDNETSVTADWGRFWSEYIRKKASEAGKKIHVTEMWDPHDLGHISHRETFDHPQTYSFVEISQNNHQRGENQWDNGLRQIERLRSAGNLRPVNNVKTYGNWQGRHGGGTHNGVESFIRSVLFGSAAVRFHRPPSGLGLGDTAQSVIRSIRTATDRFSFFDAAPHNELLGGRQVNEAYCRAVPGREYMVYFTGPGEVEMDLQSPAKRFAVRRLEILTGQWSDETVPSDGNLIILRSDRKHLLYLIKKK